MIHILRLGRCKGGQCFAPCNYPVGECNYETGLCICPDGVLGANCTGRCLGGCTGHGTCELDIDGATGKCVCDAGYRSGNSLRDVPTMFILYIATKFWNIEGIVSLICLGSYYSLYAGIVLNFSRLTFVHMTADCSITCPGVPLFRACRGNGVCNADGKCSCRSGWRGSDYSIECPGGNFNPCSGHGLCSPAATCTCDWGYTGGQCQYTCPGLHGKPCGCASPADPGQLTHSHTYTQHTHTLPLTLTLTVTYTCIYSLYNRDMHMYVCIYVQREEEKEKGGRLFV